MECVPLKKSKKKVLTALVAAEKKPSSQNAHCEQIDLKALKQSVDQILLAHKKCGQTAGTALTLMIWIGRALSRIKATMRHGEWGVLCKSTIARQRLSYATIRRYIQVYDRTDPEKTKLLPEEFDGIQAGIERLELPGTSVTAIYRALGMVATPAKSHGFRGTGKPYSPEKHGRLKFEEVTEGCKWLASLNGNLPALAEIADCTNSEVREKWAMGLTPIVRVAEAVGIEPQRRSRIRDAASAVKALDAVDLWLRQQGHSLSGGEKQAIIIAAEAVRAAASRSYSPSKAIRHDYQAGAHRPRCRRQGRLTVCGWLDTPVEISS